MKTIGEKNAVSIVACDDNTTIRFASNVFFFLPLNMYYA